MNWIISAFNLCSATFIPLWGQLVDIFGRTVTLELTLILMMIGSALCVAAPLNAFPLLILGRALQGLSVSGINVCKYQFLEHSYFIPSDVLRAVYPRNSLDKSMSRE
jgi:MFS family permease